MNCWEYKKCGRQSGGDRSRELGVCPVTTHRELNGVHDGTHAGRACWVVAGSLCGGRIQGAFAQKLTNCWRCDFMISVKQDEDGAVKGFSVTRLGMERSLLNRAADAMQGRTSDGDQT